MAAVLNERSFVPVLLPACTLLLEKHSGHCLYCFLAVGAGASREWFILPRHRISMAVCGWDKKDEATIDQWLAAKGFRTFMLPSQRAQFRNPVVDCVNGKLVIRSGKKKITALNT